MAEAEFSQCSSSTYSTPRSKCKYAVFLSFRGEDTRHAFTDHLYTALINKGIVTFRDKERLERGQDIRDEPFKAIEVSLCALVILSQNYASSTWCLDELQKIVQSKCEVLPVFYGVDPSDVRKQTGSFAKAFERHEDNFKGDQDQNKVRNWRDALTKVANLSGWTSGNRYETHLIEEIAEAVCTKLLPNLPSSFDGLVGITSKVLEVKSLVKTEDVCFVGIWGMGGIGKTTLASVVYEGICSEFEISCFLANVREVSEEKGLVHLQTQLLSSLKLRKFEIKNEYEGREKIRHFLSKMKVLLVLDDVSDKNQLDNLAGKREWFGPGSRVIITTRDMHVLTPKELFKMYDIEKLNSDEALQLLCQHAFNKDKPEDEYLKLSKAVLEYCGGLPLALKVLGSFLCGKSVPEWQCTLNRMKQGPGDDIIFKTLKISYNGLSMEDRAIFLDIACFIHNLEEYALKMTLEDFGHDATLGLNILAEKSLLSYEKPFYRMHDLLRQLGERIVLEESPHDASQRSRLWSLKEIDQVLSKNEGKYKIQGIRFISPRSYRVEWHEDCFSKMSGLRLLLISGDVHFSHGLKSLPSALKVISWDEYPLKALPDIVQLDELVYLELGYSKLRRLWNRTQFLGKLNYMDLSQSKDLVTTPDFAGLPNLEKLILKCCARVVEVHPSLGQHKKLGVVDFSGCEKLRTLPSKLSMNSLKTFILSGCLELRRLPEFGEDMKSLLVLELEETAIANLPPSLGFLTNLSDLNLKGCKNLVSFPNTMRHIKSLRVLNISFCSKVSRLPENLNENVHLEELHVRETAIREVPSCVVHLKNLKVLNFRGCKGTSTLSLPLSPSFSGLSLLRTLNLSYCNLCDESIPDDFSCLPSLWMLDLMGNNFANLPATCISNLLKLQRLRLRSCSRLRSLPKLPPNLSSVETIYCDSLEPLLDMQQLLNPLATHDFQNFLTHDALLYGGDFVWATSGNEIPYGFQNKNFRFRGSLQSDSRISITVDIPDHCLHSSEWSAIAVCLLLEERWPTRRESDWFRSIHWGFESVDNESKYFDPEFVLDKYYADPILFVAFFPLNNFNCWRHLRGGHTNRLSLTISTRRFTSDGKIIDHLREEECNRLGIKACRWDLLRQKDFEMRRNIMGQH